MVTNHCFRPRVRRLLASGLLIGTALVALALPISVHAQFTGKAVATGQFESNSNVFAVQSGYTPVGPDASRRSDTYYAYGANLDGNYFWGRQEFYATASTKEIDYQHLTELNHNDFKIDAGLLWELGSAWNGKLDISRTRQMVPFYDLTGAEQTLSLATDQTESAEVDLKVTSNWKLRASGYTTKSEQPIPGAPDLELTQNSGSMAIDYLGIANLTGGLAVGYLSGSYDGSTGMFNPLYSTFGAVTNTANPSYAQETAGFQAHYKHYFTTFEGQFGYTRRTSDASTNATSGFTGLFDLVHQLTPKTSVTAQIDRTIDSYLLNAGSAVDSDVSVGITWQATYKLAGTLNYVFTYRDFPRQGNNPIGTNRIDIQEHWTLGANYQAARWLVIKPYADVQARRTTYIGGAFSQTIFGVIVTVSKP